MTAQESDIVGAVDISTSEVVAGPRRLAHTHTDHHAYGTHITIAKSNLTWFGSLALNTPEAQGGDVYSDCKYDRSGNLYVATDTNSDSQIFKFYPDGTIAWEVDIGYDCYVCVLSPDHQYLYVGADSDAGTPKNNIYKVRCSDGVIMWSNAVGVDDVRGIDVDPDGNIYIGIEGAVAAAVVLAKLSPAGGVYWSKVHNDFGGGVYTGFECRCAVNQYGEVYYFGTQADFGGVTYHQFKLSTTGIIIKRIVQTGSVFGLAIAKDGTDERAVGSSTAWLKYYDADDNELWSITPQNSTRIVAITFHLDKLYCSARTAGADELQVYKRSDGSLYDYVATGGVDYDQRGIAVYQTEGYLSPNSRSKPDFGPDCGLFLDPTLVNIQDETYNGGGGSASDMIHTADDIRPSDHRAASGDPFHDGIFKCLISHTQHPPYTYGTMPDAPMNYWKRISWVVPRPFRPWVYVEDSYWVINELCYYDGVYYRCLQTHASTWTSDPQTIYEPGVAGAHWAVVTSPTVQWNKYTGFGGMGFGDDPNTTPLYYTVAIRNTTPPELDGVYHLVKTEGDFDGLWEFVRHRPGRANIKITLNLCAGAYPTAYSELEMKHSEIADDYNAADDYAVGDIVVYDDSWFECIQANGPAAPKTPDSEPTYWTEYESGFATPLTAFKYDTTDNYGINCDLQNIEAETGTGFASYYPGDIAEWSAAVDYTAGDLAAFAGRFYRALNDHRNSEPPSERWEILQ